MSNRNTHENMNLSQTRRQTDRQTDELTNQHMSHAHADDKHYKNRKKNAKQ